MRRRARALALAVSAAALLAGCTGGDPSPSGATSGPTSAPSSAPSSGAPTAPVLPGVESYVALGDSFTSGPLIPPSAEGGPGVCPRSAANYPHLLAKALGVADFTDASCAGASTADVDGHDRDGRVTPQVDAVKPDTDLVTVGIGGNDEGLFQSLTGCVALRDRDPSGSPCRDSVSEDAVRGVLETIRSNVAAALDAVHDKAPDALVVLVGYPRILPDSGTCDAVPFASGDYAFGREVEQGLEAALRGAAADSRSTFVSMRDASRGHDACAGDDAWVNGSETRLGAALAFHPFARGMQGVADTLLAAAGR